MQPYRAIRLFLLFIIVASLPAIAGAQSAVSVLEWETLRPEGEEFTIQMPKNSTAETSKEPYHKMMLNTRLYLVSNPSGGVFAVVSMSGIKANPALYSEMERLNSYVDAFKHWFPPKVRGKGAVAKLTLVGNKTMSGHAGREYRLTIGELSGPAQVYATRKRFYAIAALNAKKEEALSDRFLSSFELPQKITEAPKAVAAQRVEKPEEPNPPQDKPVPKSDLRSQPAEAATETATEVKPGEAGSPTEPGKRNPISGGVLNGKAISLPKPDYPADARTAKAAGTVVVQVTIDEYGNVLSAKAVSGHPLLQQASVNAALQARFSPTFLMGEPVKVTGVITYNFVQ